MDQIILKNLSFFAHHGVLESEKKQGQPFIVNAILYLDLSISGKSDNLADTLDYHGAYSLIKEIITHESYNLIESLAESISESLFKAFNGLNKIDLEIRKPEPPVKGVFDYFAVKIFRKRL